MNVSPPTEPDEQKKAIFHIFGQHSKNVAPKNPSIQKSFKNLFFGKKTRKLCGNFGR